MVRNRTRTPGQKKILRVMLLIEYLYHGKRTVDEIADEFNIHARTAYRYLNLLDSLGFEIEQGFDNRYFIADDSCPLCGKKDITKGGIISTSITG